MTRDATTTGYDHRSEFEQGREDALNEYPRRLSQTALYRQGYDRGLSESVARPPTTTVDGKEREDVMPAHGNNTDGWIVPLDETRAVRFVAVGEPIYGQPASEGERVRVLPGGFTGTLMGYARDGDAIVWHDTHFGSPCLHTPAHLIERV